MVRLSLARLFSFSICLAGILAVYRTSHARRGSVNAGQFEEARYRYSFSGVHRSVFGSPLWVNACPFEDLAAEGGMSIAHYFAPSLAAGFILQEIALQANMPSAESYFDLEFQNSAGERRILRITAQNVRLLTGSRPQTRRLLHSVPRRRTDSLLRFVFSPHGHGLVYEDQEVILSFSLDQTDADLLGCISNIEAGAVKLFTITTADSAGRHVYSLG